MKMVFIATLAGLIAMQTGCGKSNSGEPNNAGPFSVTAKHSADQCPQGIEGLYEGLSDSGKRLALEYFRNAKGILTLKFTLEGDEANAVTFPIDGQRHSFEDAPSGYWIAYGCENSAIVGASRVDGQINHVKFTVTSDGLLLENPDAKDFTPRKFSRVK